jgi:hypothetical protein
VTDAPEVAPAAPADRPAEAAAVLRELLRLADVPATLDVKDAADGGISIAMALQVELPGVVPGRRGTFVDALQFLVNKLTHRPGSERRWVALGVGEHPPPRGPRPPLPRPPAESPPPGRPVAPPRATPQATVPVVDAPPPPPPRASVPEEAEVSEDPELTVAARALAQASATAGRFYGVVTLTAADGARMVRAVATVPGVHATVEGEGRLRRLVLTPERPTPMPKKAHPMGVDVDEAGSADEPGR